MNIADIKAAVDAGKTVNWFHNGYVVKRDNLGEYLITFTRNGSAIGLTNKAGTKLNGDEDHFFVAEPNAPVQKCCWTCGGTNVKHDAWAVWDEASQMWELDATFDHAICNDCDIETVIVDRPRSIGDNTKANVGMSNLDITTGAVS